MCQKATQKSHFVSFQQQRNEGKKGKKKEGNAIKRRGGEALKTA